MSWKRSRIFFGVLTLYSGLMYTIEKLWVGGQVVWLTFYPRIFFCELRAFTLLLQAFISLFLLLSPAHHFSHIATTRVILTWNQILSLPFFSQSVSSVVQSCPTLCDPMNRSTPGLPVHHQLPEFTQTHIHRVGDAIQPSHPLLSPSPPALNPSQHQGLFQWVNSSHEVAKVLEFQLQHQPFQWTPGTALGWTGWISLQSKGLSRVFSNTTVQKHQFFFTQLSSQSNSHIHTWPPEKP